MVIPVSFGAPRQQAAASTRKQRRRGLAAAALAVASLGATVLRIPDLGPARALGLVRRGLAADMDCEIHPAVWPQQDLAPTFIASYPGSGAKMTWNLVQAVTGLLTGDEHVLNDVAWSRSVTVKTHFPHLHGNPNIDRSTTNDHFPMAVLLLRNPADAIPGFHNYLYEIENNLPGHSVRAPLEDWIEWRDENVMDQIKEWENHTAYWMERYPEAWRRLILTYEGMVDDTWGPEATWALAAFLAQNPAVSTIDKASAACVWEKVIKYKGEAPPETEETPKPEETPEISEAEETPEISEAEETPQTPETPETSGAEETPETDEQPEDARRDLAWFVGYQKVVEDFRSPKKKFFDSPRRRLDATVDNPDSLRSGSKFRPYTSSQIAEMRAMLERLRTRFDDPSLTITLDGYDKDLLARSYASQSDSVAPVVAQSEA